MPPSIAFYSTPGPMTDPGPYASLFSELPTDIPSLVRIVQNNIIHVFWAERYGVQLTDERMDTLQLRSVRRKLALMTEGGCPLTTERQPAERQVGNCRDFSTLLTAILRCQGVPARARCGFGTYFKPGHYEDHWVVEYWNEGQGRWVMVDAQLDAFQQEALGIDFDPLDMRPGAFVLAGEAWQMCRREEANPDDFGIFDMSGMEFIRGNVVRDLLSLNKVEILPWDWYIGYLNDEAVNEQNRDQTYALFDQVSALTLGGEASFAELRELYETDANWHIPADWE